MTSEGQGSRQLPSGPGASCGARGPFPTLPLVPVTKAVTSGLPGRMAALLRSVCGDTQGCVRTFSTHQRDPRCLGGHLGVPSLRLLAASERPLPSWSETWTQPVTCTRLSRSRPRPSPGHCAASEGLDGGQCRPRSLGPVSGCSDPKPLASSALGTPVSWL